MAALRRLSSGDRFAPPRSRSDTIVCFLKSEIAFAIASDLLGRIAAFCAKRWENGASRPLQTSAGASSLVKFNRSCVAGRQLWKSHSRLMALRSNFHEIGSQVDVP